MWNLLNKFFPPRPDIVQEVVDCYLNRLPDEVSVAFKKEDDLLIGKILIEGDEDPIFIQARTPSEFTKMLNEAIYVTFDFQSHYIDFFHEKGDRYQPTPEARFALEKLYEKSGSPFPSGFEHAFGFKSVDESKLVQVAS